MAKSTELSDNELNDLEDFLERVNGGKISNPESLDGFFAALAVCPDQIMPSEYLPVIQSGQSEEGDLVFESMGEAQKFMGLVQKHWNHVVHQLNDGMVFLPLLLEDESGIAHGNDWAKGFMTGTHMRQEIWGEFMDDEEHAGAIVPIMALAHEHDSDPEMRPFSEPIDAEHREKLIIGSAAGVMKINEYFLARRADYEPETQTFVRERPKVGRNDPCPCGSGKKYKKCCGGGPTLH